MPRTSAVNMKCPRSEHAGSRVKLDGTYGKPGHRRQRYTCLPGGGGKPHVFTELLPREESWHSSCEHCERQLERREGPKAPRHYPVSYTHLRAHETDSYLVCRLLLEKKKNKQQN